MQQPESTPESGIAIYADEAGLVRLVVRLKGESLWLTQKQMAELFGIDQSVVARHLRNIFSSGELDAEASMQKMHRTPGSGGRPGVAYSLDAVISVGYRSNSLRATQFRIWATKTLRQFLMKGYALNTEALLEAQSGKVRELQEVIGSVARLASSRQLVGREGDVLELINEYAHSWKMLEQYDSGSLNLSDGTAPRFHLTYDVANRLVGAVREQMSAVSPQFGQEIHGKFRAVLGALSQSFEGGEMYPSAEEKAANLLYYVIRDHPFVDGNKRIGSFLFIYYLQQNGIWFKESGERRISDNALGALALMVAESEAGEKAVITGLIVSVLRNG